MIFLYHLREFSPLPWLYPIADSMLHGVSFFFVLSGFVLSHAYGERGRLSLKTFWLTRFARIWPTHIAGLALLVVLLPFAWARGQNLSLGMTAFSLAAKVAMVDCLFPIRGVALAWNDVSWSISTEMFFYAAFPFLLIAVRRDALATLALAALAAVSLFALGVALGLPIWDGDRMTPTLVNLGSYNPLARGFEFVLGMGVYRFWRRWVALAPLSASAWTALEAGALTLLVAWLVFAVPTIEERLGGALFVWFRVSGSSWACALLILVIAAGRGAIGRLLSTRPFVYLGEISYAFYIYHVIALRALAYHFGPQPSAIAAFALSLYLAAANRRAIEETARAWLLARFKRGAGVPAPASAVSPP